MSEAHAADGRFSGEVAGGATNHRWGGEHLGAAPAADPRWADAMGASPTAEHHWGDALNGPPPAELRRPNGTIASPIPNPRWGDEPVSPPPPRERTWGVNEITLLVPQISNDDATEMFAKVGPKPTLRDLAVHHQLRVADARPDLGHYIKRLWHYRHFIASYANAKVAVSYGKARLGRLWQVLTPLTNAAVYYIVFGVVLGTKAGIPNFIAYLCTGLFIFGFTQTAVLNGLQSISSNLGLVRALHFPRACLPFATTLTQFQNLAVSMVVLVGITVATGENPSTQWLLIIPAVLLQSVFNTGMALLAARLGAKLGDLKQVAPFVMRTWMYGSGVLYSVDRFADNLPPAAAAVVEANPLLVYIELVRHALLESAPLTGGALKLWLLGSGWAVLMFVIGFVYFWRGEREYGRG